MESNVLLDITATLEQRQAHLAALLTVVILSTIVQTSKAHHSEFLFPPSLLGIFVFLCSVYFFVLSFFGIDSLLCCHRRR